MGKRGPGAKPKRSRGQLPIPTRKPSWQWEGLSRPERVIRFIEGLQITSGAHAGRKFKLRPWQREIIHAWYETDGEGKRIARDGLLTMGRKNGKTALIAALALAHLIGPETIPRGQIVVGAADRDQSGLIFNELCAWIEGNPAFEDRCNIKAHEKVIVDEETGTTFRALSSDAKKSHGLSPSLVIMDELAQWGDGVGRKLYEALVTATGAHAEPLSIVISTQADNDQAKMSEIIDHGARVLAGEVDEPTFKPFIFKSDEDADIWDEATWYQANPALGDFRDLEEMRRFAKTAKEIPSQEAIFRNLYLNQRVDAEPEWIGKALWQDCKADLVLEDHIGAKCYGGLDLGSTRDLTSFALYFPDSGALFSWSWCPAENLGARELIDRVPYRVWEKKGWITATEGRAVNKREVLLDVVNICEDFAVEVISYDRFGMAEIERLMQEEGVTLPLKNHGQGYKDMGPATAAFEAAVLNQKLKHPANPILTWALSNVALTTDPAGNQKPDKKKSRERIDPVVAAVMAVGTAAQEPEPVVYDFSRELVL